MLIYSMGGKKILKLERRTIGAMLAIYCRAHHGGGLCGDCKELLEYANLKLDKCPFGEDKPACEKCDIHCYEPEMRERVREVMRYSGPRMLKRHPVLAIRHMLRRRKKPSAR